jgi:hypothetical protein
MPDMIRQRLLITALRHLMPMELTLTAQKKHIEKGKA